MAIEKYKEKTERLIETTSSLSKREISNIAMFSGSTDVASLETKFEKISARDMYYSIVDLSEKVDDFGDLTNIMSSSIDGGTF